MSSDLRILSSGFCTLAVKFPTVQKLYLRRVLWLLPLRKTLQDVCYSKTLCCSAALASILTIKESALADLTDKGR